MIVLIGDMRAVEILLSHTWHATFKVNARWMGASTKYRHLTALLPKKMLTGKQYELSRAAFKKRVYNEQYHGRLV